MNRSTNARVKGLLRCRVAGANQKLKHFAPKIVPAKKEIDP
ncbi:MAG TPA: hypothetical protein VFY05_08700 [Candidatus Angelobacter sp.]|nr:hypothetical protein [Candidatus Angelobacter sp.]